jgi:hypothetical protein
VGNVRGLKCIKRGSHMSRASLKPTDRHGECPGRCRDQVGPTVETGTSLAVLVPERSNHRQIKRKPNVLTEAYIFVSPNTCGCSSVNRKEGFERA